MPADSGVTGNEKQTDFLKKEEIASEQTIKPLTLIARVLQTTRLVHNRASYGKEDRKVYTEKKRTYFFPFRTEHSK